MKVRHLRVLFIVLLLVGTGLATASILPDTPPPQLEFPIAESDLVERLSAYHTPDWGEPGVYHNGIDLVISTDVTVIAPCSGKITAISETVNPYAGNVLFSIGITVDFVWAVKLVLEPGFHDDTNNSAQHDAIRVSIGESVTTGTELARLLHSENYPHLHYMLLYHGMDVSAYDFSSPTAKAIFEDIAARSNSTIEYPYEFPSKTDSLNFRLMLGGGLLLVAIALVGLRRTAKR